MSAQKNRWIWSAWLVVFTLFLFALEQVEVFSAFISLEVLSFLLLVIVTAMFPIHYRNHNLTLFQWLGIAIFIVFGFSVEVVTTQIGVLAALIASGLNRSTLYRIPINSLIFFITSSTSALAFYIVGGQTGDSFSFLLHGHAILLYALTFHFMNHLLIFAVKRYVFIIQNQNVVKGLKRELIIGCVLLPTSLILVVLFWEIGILAVVFTGIVFFVSSFFLRAYTRTERMNDLLKEVTNVGYELNSSMTEEELMNRVCKRLELFLEWDQLYLYRVGEERLSLSYMQQKGVGAVPLTLKYGDAFSKLVIKSEKIEMADMRQQWLTLGANLPSHLETIISVPLKSQKTVKGVLTIASSKRKAFLQQQVMVVEIIANMLSIALSNVKQLEKSRKQSYHCPLTGLYNYRYFEKVLHETLEQKDQIASLILLDLDHFKRINDTYGHQSGNEVLIEVANRLVATVREEVTVARYGGEEFVLLLPNTSIDEAYRVGLRIQAVLKESPFLVKQDLSTHGTAKINVTASIGVASSETAEEDEKSDAVTLIRKADRAMYNGAKQKGRDRVATYYSVKASEVIIEGN